MTLDVYYAIHLVAGPIVFYWAFTRHYLPNNTDTNNK